MPGLVTRGARSARGFGFSSGWPIRPATFIGSTLNVTAGTSQAVTWPGGTAAGDVALIYCLETTGGPDTASITGGAGGWAKSTVTWSIYGYRSAVFTKALALADLAGVTVTGMGGGSASPVISTVYRGATAAVLQSTNPGATGTTLPLTGFNKGSSFRGIVTFAADRDATANPSPPNSFTARAGPGSPVTFTANAADLLNAASYPNGSTVTWTNFAATFNQIGFLFELT